MKAGIKRCEYPGLTPSSQWIRLFDSGSEPLESGGSKLLTEAGEAQEKSDQYLRTQLTVELNLAITGPALEEGAGANTLAANRRLLASHFPEHLTSQQDQWIRQLHEILLPHEAMQPT